MALAATLLAGVSAAQLTPSSEKVTAKVAQDRDGYRPGESFRLLFGLSFEPGWHGQSNKPSLESLIPTTLDIAAEGDATFGRVSYPEGTMERFEFSETALSTYKDTVYIGVSGAMQTDAAPGEYPAEANITVQACDDTSCLPPSNIAIPFVINVVTADTEITMLRADLFAANEALFGGAEQPDDGSSIADYLTSNGLLLTMVFIFVGGLALNLTPCVYPLIPITVSYFGGQGKSSQTKLIANAIFYLLGMAVMYSTLGVVAAMTASLFGALLQHWAMILFIAVVLTALALSMFGLYEIAPPAILTEIGGKNREGLAGAFMMGLTVGIIAAPCIGPFVIGLLTFVGETGDPVLGSAMFFMLALGLGAPFVVLAIFSGSISSLPRSGEWMIWVRQFFGFVLLGMTIYFLEPLIPEPLYLPLFGAFIIGAGLCLGWISSAGVDGHIFKMFRWAVGLAAVALGLFMITSSQSAEGPAMKWENVTAKALEVAKAEGKPVVIDFTADWCLPCKELEHFTFSDEQVIETAKSIKALKADLTKSGNTAAEAIKEQFNVSGVPTIVFIDSSGAERTDLRFVGFISAEKFNEKLQSLLN